MPSRRWEISISCRRRSAPLDGKDRISGFQETDPLDLKAYQFANFAAVKALASNVGDDLVIGFSASARVVINNFTLAEFDEKDVFLA